MDWALFSDPGTRRVNEDSVALVKSADGICFLVADGLGGHGMGDVASSLAAEAFETAFPNCDRSLGERISDSLLLAQERIVAEQAKSFEKAQMKTTATALAINRKEVVWAHIGDTRLYAFARGKVRTRTLDHSVPQMLVRMGQIREHEIRNHPDRNKLLRVLGVAGETPGFVLEKPGKRRRFQAFLLCSDGFWELIDEKDMEACLKKVSSAQEWLDRMVAIVRENGQGKAMDNFSAVAVLL